METQSFLLFRIVFTGLFIATLLAGAYMFRNLERILGPDADHPSETSGARALNKAQLVLIWGHAVFLTGGFALMFH